MTTEFHQPINPIRIVTGSDENIFISPVFAIAISNDNHVQYLTVNGGFYDKGSIMFAEQLIDSQWTRLESHQRIKLATSPTSDT